MISKTLLVSRFHENTKGPFWWKFLPVRFSAGQSCLSGLTFVCVGLHMCHTTIQFILFSLNESPMLPGGRSWRQDHLLVTCIATSSTFQKISSTWIVLGFLCISKHSDSGWTKCHTTVSPLMNVNHPFTAAEMHRGGMRARQGHLTCKLPVFPFMLSCQKISTSYWDKATWDELHRAKATAVTSLEVESWRIYCVQNCFNPGFKATCRVCSDYLDSLYN